MPRYTAIRAKPTKQMIPTSDTIIPAETENSKVSAFAANCWEKIVWETVEAESNVELKSITETSDLTL